jgi:hypothetical protein
MELLHFFLHLLPSLVPKQEKVCRGPGYFNCPHCGRRQPGELYETVTRRYLGGHGIPLSHGEASGPEVYRCLVCPKEVTAYGHYGYDFGPHARRQTWKCFHCKGEVPYERFDCPHCGYRFQVGGR